VRITTIYEGTTAIQSNDFVGRKIARDQGAAVTALISDVRRELAELDIDHAGVREARELTLAAVDTFADAVARIPPAFAQGPERALAISVPLLRLAGVVLGAWLLTKSAAIAAQRLAAGDVDRDFLQGKLAAARFYVHHVLPQSGAWLHTVRHGATSVLETEVSAL